MNHLVDSILASLLSKPLAWGIERAYRKYSCTFCGDPVPAEERLCPCCQEGCKKLTEVDS